MIELRQSALYHGPNPYARDPVAVIDMHGLDTDVDRLVQAIPALQSQTADWLVPVPPRADLNPHLRLGSFLADWALQAQTFSRGFLHAAGCAPHSDSGGTLIWVGFHDPQIAWAALRLGSNWLADLAEHRTSAEHVRLLTELWQTCARRHPDYQARIVMEAARSRDIPYSPAWGLDGFWRYGHGDRSRVLFESAPSTDGYFGASIAASKTHSKTALRALGMPTPDFRVVTEESELTAAADAVGFPCVVKPVQGNGGKGVTAGLSDLEMVRAAFVAARSYSAGPIMVEKHVRGVDHRLVVVDGRFAATIRREPPVVVGDGIRTIAELVADKNIGRDPRSVVRSAYQRPIRLDASAQLHLRGLGFSAESVVPAGLPVPVRSNANLSGGGTCVDVTDHTHPAIRAMAETIARTLNLAAMGADFLTTDISQDPAVNGGQFNEINTVPALDTMVAAGWPVERTGDLALGNDAGRIPVQLLVVADSALRAATQTAHARKWPPGCGWATWDEGAHAGAALILDTRQLWGGVRTLMGHRTVSRAVVIASDRQILAHGLPLDRFTTAQVACALPDAWLEVLRTWCDQVDVHDPPADASDWPQMLVASLR